VRRRDCRVSVGERSCLGVFRRGLMKQRRGCWQKLYWCAASGRGRVELDRSTRAFVPKRGSQPAERDEGISGAANRRRSVVREAVVGEVGGG
jgi:hypothetical protein